VSLSAGARIGPYEIVEPLGAGGMGEVYRARDTKLNRDVAIKVLRADLSTNADRFARLEREAQLLAALNHPNIAHIYGLEETSIVMELVEGHTLADRITAGAIPVREALRIAKQIADALEAAHEQGIVHRDLKPANVKVRDDGTVKVLDFGLAKAVDPAADSAGASRALSLSPTLTFHATQMGVILGTAAYMSPEQAAGKPVDKRADMWAFGVVLLEMLTGRETFTGETVSHVLAHVLTKDPDFTAIPADTPDAIRKLLRRCLEKDRKRRLDSAAVARLEIEDALSATPVEQSIDKPVRAASSIVPWVVGTAAGVALGAVVALWAAWRKPAASPAPVRLLADVGADLSIPVGNGGPSAVLSADGSKIAFVGLANGKTQLYIRSLDQLHATPVAGTDGAIGPLFSPDGRWIAFFAEGKLKKVAVTGGATMTLCDAQAMRGGSWSEDGTIVFSPSNAGGTALMRVSAAGGTPERAGTLLPGEVTQRWPQVLPGGKAVLFMGSTHTGGNYDDGNIEVMTLPSGTPKIVQRGGYLPRYVSSGHLLYMHDGTVFAEPFDLGRLEVTGQPVPVLEGVAGGNGGGAQYSISDNGTIVYVPGSAGTGSPPISWMAKDGKTTPLRAAAANWSNPQFSPDGTRLAMDIQDGAQLDVWVYEWTRDTLTRLTFDPRLDFKPIWTPDSRGIVFGSTRSGVGNLYWKRADGTGDDQRLTNSPNAQVPGSIHPSGKFIAYSETHLDTGDDVMVAPLEGDERSGWKVGAATTFVAGRLQDREPKFSPDGRWIAYFSDESGRPEVYVRPFPGPGGKWQISNAGGTEPTWSLSRHELFYMAPGAALMVVAYSVDGDSFRADKPRLWSPTPIQGRPRQRAFDLHPDGQRFAVGVATSFSAADKQDKLTFIFDFADDLRRLTSNAQR